MCPAGEKGTGAGVLPGNCFVRGWPKNLPHWPKFPTGFPRRFRRPSLKNGRPEQCILAIEANWPDFLEYDSVTEPIIRAQAVEKFYVQPDGNRIEVVAPVDLDVEPGKIVTLLGPSGCGKSTLLRILTGLSKPSSGTVLWHGSPLTSQNAGVSIVFQSFALFPWLTVLDNVEAPLEARGVPAVERHKRALRILDTVGLDGFESAYPKELSGGMKQRVGFARALVVEPEVLFMDEPFSALDVLTAENLRNELLELWLSKKIP